MKKGSHITVIAEAGVNHNGDMALAKQMIEKAKEAGADYIKFQTFRPEKLVSKYAPKAEYQKETTGKEDSQLAMLQKLTLAYPDFIELKEHCSKTGIGFLSSPFDMESIVFLKKLEMDFWKIPSGEVTNLPYLEAIGQTGNHVVMSTGMCSLEEIETAVHVLEMNGTKEITLLHCNTEYPTPFRDVNLLAMKQMAEIFQRSIGYSDHTIGIEVPIAAAALGASVIEKHFTLDKTMEGPDHRASLEPKELAQMIQAIRNVEDSLGEGLKRCSASEEKNRSVARKSIVAVGEIVKGEYFSETNITTKRPGNGVSPMKWHELIGRAARRTYQEDEPIDEMELE